MATLNRLITITLCCLFVSHFVIGAVNADSHFFNRRILSTDSASDINETKPKKEYPSSSAVEIVSNFIDSELQDIMWCGDDAKNILILTSKGTIYQTTDQGKNWTKLRETFQRTGKREISGEQDVGTVIKMLQSPLNTQLVIFLGSAGINWMTEDCGQNIKAINTGKNIKEFQFHPNEPNWVLASAYTTCDDFVDEPCRIYKELYYSKDLGVTWTFVADYVIQFSWGIQEGFFSVNVPNDRIVIAHLLDKKGNQKVKGWSERAEIAFSDDYFKSKTVVKEQGNKFLITKDYFFAVQVDDEDTQNVRLYVGSADAKNYDLQPIMLPAKKSKKKKKEGEILEHSYTLLDTSEGQVFLHINHEGEKSKHGNIYISDSTGRRFSLSAHNNVRNPNGQCDFEKVSGLEGIFLANVYDADMVKKLKDDFKGDEEIPTSQRGSKPTGKSKPFQSASSLSKDKDKRNKELDQYKTTIVSFDKGGIWEPLKPPKKNVDGEKIECDKEEDCSLHLHSVSNMAFGPFYSTESSLGIVLGVGNVGRYLSNNDDEVNTYLSRDGGLTWFEVLNGSHIYEIGDHGAIIAAAPDQGATKVLQYTWNEGLTWDSVEISKTPIQVSNIIIEPTNTAEHFIIYGRTALSSKDSTKEPKGVIISVDFASLHERTCKDPDHPGSENSDYETWSPNDGTVSEKCLMGHQSTYLRRKREAQCFNNEKWERWLSYENCQCTEEDWECDMGYERKKDGPCESQTNENITYDPPSDCDGDFYYVTQGYRKVAGNTCEGGVNHEPIKLPCPGKGFARSHVITLLVLAAVIAALCFFSNKGSRNQAAQFAQSLGEKAKAAATGGNSHVKHGFQKMGEGRGPDSLHEEDEDFDNRLKFDDHDEPARHFDGKNLTDVRKGGKKMAGRTGLDTAQKNIPMISKPGKGSDDQSRELSDF